MVFQALRGTSDIFQAEATAWAELEQTLRAWAACYGYSEIRTPIIEPAGLFLRSIGEMTDIVQKEMFRFEDRGGNDIVLRPEGTAAVVRAFLEHHLYNQQALTRLFYLGPMFRAERPQAGRFRQFHQYGVEAIGSASPWVDVEVIALCVDSLRACGVRDLAVWVSSMGTREDQQRSAAYLRERLLPIRAQLPDYLQQRFDTNIFRVLDCKDEAVQQLVWQRIDRPFLLSEGSQAHFDTVRRGLEELGIPFDDSQAFARGLDYYTQTVFEVRATGLGAQDAVAAGGRYDNLVAEMGGPALGAVGFAAGIERIRLAIQAQQPSGAVGGREGCCLIVLHESVRAEARALLYQLRRAGHKALMDYELRSMKAQLRDANQHGFRYALLLGQQEMAQQAVAVKDLENAQQQLIRRDALLDWLSSHDS
jgi:histidyl-tRNA synthetase